MLEDREKVRELLARYSAIDSVDRHEEWLELFTSDVKVRSSVGAPVNGKDELRQFTEMLAQSSYGAVQMRHVIDNVTMNLQATSGTAECILTVWHTANGKTIPFMVGIMNARLVKVGSDWRIRELDQLVDTNIGDVNLER